MTRGISVIIPTHRRSVAIVQRAVDSVRTQHVDRPLEILISDNAGDFHINEIKSKGVTIHYIDSSRVPGVSFARNAGVEESHYEYVAFLDDDDVWLPGFASILAKKLDTNECDMVICGFTNRNGYTTSGSKVPGNSITVQDIFLRNPGFTGSTFMIRRKAFYDIQGFDNQLYTSNDKDFFIRFLLNSKRYCGVPTVLVHRDDSPHARLTTVSEKKIASTRLFLEKYRTLMSDTALREYNFKIAVMQALHARSVSATFFLFFSHSGRLRTLFAALRHILFGREFKV